MPAKNPRKRKVSSSRTNGNTTKRAKIRESVTVGRSDEADNPDPELQASMSRSKAQEDTKQLAVMDIDEDESDMQQILAQIKALEESERLAKGEYGQPGPSGLYSAGNSSDLEIVSDTPLHELGTSTGKSTPVVLPDEGLKPFRDLFIGSRECTGCGKLVKSPRGRFVFSTSLISPSLMHLLHAPCGSCHTNHCRGCFKRIDCPSSCKGTTKNLKCDILNCCAEGRAIAIFETVGSFDRRYLTEQSAAQSRANVIAKNAAKSTSVGPGGTGYGIGTSRSTSQKQELMPLKTNSTWEVTIIRAMQALTHLLPEPYSDSPQVYDMLPHPSIGHLISLSQMPTILTNLLRNDSVADWISREETYNTMLQLLRRMADSELTIQCLIGQRWKTVTTCGIEEWMWQNGEIAWSQNFSGQLEIAPPLYTYFKKLTKQSESFQVGAMRMLSEEQDEADVEEMIIRGTSLCGDIIATRDSLERVITMLGQSSSAYSAETELQAKSPVAQKSAKGKGKGKGKVAIEIDKGYSEACERLAFNYVSLWDGASKHGHVYPNYNFSIQLTETQMSTRVPKDRLHLLKELAVMATSLPPGIWVRVDDVRNDAIKVMISGPDGTPYAGGLFEFDCFLPLGYPNQPPLVHLRTTGGGTVRFNPNLYECGRVCLSLLGTWSGRPEEQWQPGKSTLLQVLISIQSMILNDVPYYNEPGSGNANPKAHVSITYNEDICAKSVRWAIVDWLKDEHRTGIWRDVIASHFMICKDKIRERIVEWSVKVPKNLQSGDLIQQFYDGMEVVESWNVDLFN